MLLDIQFTLFLDAHDPVAVYIKYTYIHTLVINMYFYNSFIMKNGLLRDHEK
jgi:hypothetical protein